MRKLMITLITVFFFGCSVHTTNERITKEYVYNFKKYTEEGFFISPDPYPNEFKPLGLITIHIYPGKKKQTKKEEGFGGGEYEVYIEESISPYECLDNLVKKAKDMGANGLSNFNFEVNWIYDNRTDISEKVYIVSGFAIKIE
jgi:uncharacterized protein YbjQ (UPF0145 family)